jgi:hypothetical protein
VAPVLKVSLFPIFFALILTGSSPAAAQETGILSVTTTPVRGTIYVDNSLVGKSFWSGSLEVGPHQVSFGEVEGYSTPAPQAVMVMANQTVFSIGIYRKLFSRHSPDN